MRLNLNLVALLFLIVSLPSINVHSQDQLLVKSRIVKGKTNLFNTVSIDTYLYNKGAAPITLFVPDLASQTWGAYEEVWEVTSPKGVEKIEYLKGRAIEGAWKKFNINDFVNVRPGDSVLISTLTYTFKQPGAYGFKYTYEHNKKLRVNLATDDAAKTKAATTPSVTLTTQLSYDVKDVPIPDFKPTLLTADEVYKKKEIVTVDEAFAAPQDVYRLTLSKVELSDLLMEKICKLKNLHTLELMECSGISSLPPAIGGLNLISLRVKIQDYELKDFTLPAELAKLRNLEVLFVDAPVSTFPESIVGMTTLKALTLVNGKYTSLPETFGNLKNLNQVNLSRIPLTHLPKSIGDLPLMEWISIDEVPLVELPEEIGNLPKLRFLQVQNSKLQKIPASIGKLENLTDLYVLTANLTTFPTEVLTLKKVITLNFTGNQITSIPPEIGQLKTLRALYMVNNKLADLPIELGQLANIQVIASGNGIGKTDNVKALRKMLNVKLYL